MMKSLLKQVSLAMLCVAVSLGMTARVARAVDFTNAKDAVDSTKFFDPAKKISAWMGTWADSEKKAYKKIKKQIDKKEAFALKKAGANLTDANKAKSDLEKRFKETSNMLNVDTMDSMKSQMGSDIKKKAKDIATGKEALRLLNEEVVDAMEQQADKTSKAGPGVPTKDYANITTGMFNLDSVYQAYHANEGVRDEDTRVCSAMGISDKKEGESSGKLCCEKWAVLQNSKSPSTKEYGEKTETVDRNNVGRGTMLDSVEGKSAKELEEMCCKLSPDLCKTKAQEKAECLNGHLSEGGTLAEGWKVCDIECGDKDYGELVHNEDEKYNEEQIDDIKKIDELMNQCYGGGWAPSPAVLTASELAPVVPEVAKEYLVSKNKSEK